MGNNADGSSFINNNESDKGGLHLGGAGAAYNNGHIFISGSGKVGIGTITPAEKLTIDTGNIQLSNGYQIQWGDSATAIFGNATSDYIRLKTAGLDRLSVDSAGNVGIGTINPTAQPAEKNDLVIGDNTGNRGMTIASTNTGIGTIRFAPNTSANDIEGWIDYSGNTKKMRFGTNGLNTRMTIDNAGSVGIGEGSPDTVLHTVGDSGLTIEETGATGRKLIIEPPTAATVGTIRTHDTGAGLLLKSYNAGNQMFLKDDGNVGIGMTAPNEKLTVQGAISFDQLAPADVPTHTAGYGKLYVKPDNCLYFKDADGAESNLVLEDGFKAHRLVEGDNASHVGSNINDLSLTDYFVSVKTVANGDSLHGAIQIRLPDPTGNAGKSYMIKDIGGHAGSGTPQTVTVNAVSSNVEGGSHTFSSSDSAIGVYTDGDNWFIF